MRRNTVSNVTVKKRLIFLFFCMVLAIVALLLRLFWLQIVVAGELQAKAWDQWTRGDPVRAPRGDILDRNEQLLAGSASSVSILAYPAQIEDKEEAARKLAPVLDMEEEAVLERLQRQSSSVYLKRKMDEEDVLEIRKLEIRGIRFSLEPKRYYPHERLASQLLGFSGIDAGLSGIEYRYEEELKGRDGRAEFQTDGLGRQIPQGVQTFNPPIDGHDLILTVDQNIQFIMEQEMERAMLDWEPEEIMAVAVDPNTGGILGIAGKPDFDPNNYADYPPEQWQLTPVSSSIEPGSTFKLVTLAAAIEEGEFHAEEGFFCSGSMQVAGTTIGCWTRSRGGHGAINFTEVVLGSCNPGFITLGQRIGSEKHMHYLEAFGFGRRTGIDVMGEGLGIMFTPEQFGPVEAATTSFGQGVSVTPIQQLMAVAAMINGGYLMTPYVVDEIRDSEGNVVKKTEPQVVRRVVSEETSQEVRRIMELVVTEGSGMNAHVEGYRIGGKTGTAQKVGPGGVYISGEYILSFIGFVPAEDPQILLYIAVDNPQGVPQWGSQVSAPLFKRMAERMLKYLNIPPTEMPEHEPPQVVEVPNLTGLSVEQASEVIDTSGLMMRFIGGGNEILNQTPKAGAQVPLQTQVLAYLGGQDVGDEEVIVPDLTGKTMREAGEILGWLGLRMNGSGSGVAVGQQPDAESRVPRNSVIDVEFAAPGETGDTD
ncbi:PASTA domain-containing penicillin-binding protein [Dethiobacter alkaliphilus]|uniref:PASTA domain-containing penicillin-binding protein n=1 Tax=Dethiobacter alkaliphilus TaxID=427926 RepID=UPI002226F112|nr:PASTA domain-containing penicillin-binding protein [Dethiobacter alkaliphilus]MCW3491240.1 penicillin-binding transpeptidase domain-containing protein [Dethiobacter alkaliphilus]